MTTLMEHPKHGRHPATGHEIEQMKASGWTVCPPKVAHVEAEPVATALPEVVVPVRRTRGPNKPKA